MRKVTPMASMGTNVYLNGGGGFDVRWCFEQAEDAEKLADLIAASCNASVPRDPNAYGPINQAFARLPYSAHCIETIFATHDDTAARGIILANLQRVAAALRVVGEREAHNEYLMSEASFKMAELRQERDRMREAMQRFVDRVDAVAPGVYDEHAAANEFKEILKHGR